MRQAVIHNLAEQRRLALARVQESIDEMQGLLREAPSDSSSRVLMEGVLGALRKTEERLAAGLHQRSPR